jgi:hypothetical protein
MDKIIIVVLLLIGLYLYINWSNPETIPTQKEIQKLEYVKEKEEIVQVDELEDFPYPQISRGFKKLSKKTMKPLDNLKDLLPSGKDNLNIMRDTRENINKKRIYLPDYYRKDRLGGNDIGTEELRPFTNSEEPDNSWTDVNVSKHPKFYNSDIKNELTNVGSFFDKNNQYNDKTSSNTEVLVSDGCYTDKEGEIFCEDNTRLQNIPPSLISDINKCYALNTIGMYKDRNRKDKEFVSFNSEKIDGEELGVWSYSDDRTINGGKFFNNVVASRNKNEINSRPLERLSGGCSI